MKLYSSILIISALASIVGPWWMIGLVAFVLCFFMADSPANAYKTASAAAVSLWIGYSLILIYSGHENLVDKIGQIFKGGSSLLGKIPSLGLVIFVITLIAGLVAGFSGMAGRYLKEMFMKDISIEESLEN